ncbi:chemotaxis protein CheW [Alkalibacillus salilacus]|uniref:Purine-binding chemotaxis protein CheW n=1 Tax=Alkalibacillus salilacus TaxID=284582 RepID=A0ABT9VDN7_9BACI|nr:chemotaxis protein CheW [Alkalibacillus salilacus]MDQ0159072.1 purine-binding chemotaxis protein CheW [Alkalibacillus salilacus]
MSEVIQDDKVIVFKLKDEEYGIPIEHVGSIERIFNITRVPRAPKFVKGVMNLRGVITPIIDLRERFGLETLEQTESTRIIIIHVDDKSIGVIVDAANDVVDVPQEKVEPSPEVVGAVNADYIRGVAKIDHRLLILLNLEKVLSVEEFDELSTID